VRACVWERERSEGQEVGLPIPENREWEVGLPENREWEQSQRIEDGKCGWVSVRETKRESAREEKRERERGGGGA